MIHVDIDYFDSATELQQSPEFYTHWSDLYLHTEASPFLHLNWIQNWLKQVSNPILLVTAIIKGETVGLGILAQNTVKSLLGFKVEQWWLHRCGDTLLDQNWIEYNDFLVSKVDADSIRAAMFGAIMDWLPNTAELCVGVSDIEILEQLTHPQVNYRDTWKASGYKLPISEIYHTQSNHLNEDLLLTFSTNTRRQIKRSFKLLSQYGELSLKPLAKDQQSILFEDIFAANHKQKWGASSGFNNHDFVNFHRQLLLGGSTDILQIMMGDKPVMYIYSLINDRGVFFYMASMNSFDDNKIKLGLVGHCLAISYYSILGFKQYDFLAGEARYKTSLSSEQYVMAIRHYYKSNWKAEFESVLRMIKSKYLSK